MTLFPFPSPAACDGLLPSGAPASDVPSRNWSRKALNELTICELVIELSKLEHPSAARQNHDALATHRATQRERAIIAALRARGDGDVARLRPSGVTGGAVDTGNRATPNMMDRPRQRLSRGVHPFAGTDLRPGHSTL